MNTDRREFLKLLSLGVLLPFIKTSTVKPEPTEVDFDPTTSFLGSHAPYVNVVMEYPIDNTNFKPKFPYPELEDKIGVMEFNLSITKDNEEEIEMLRDMFYEHKTITFQRNEMIWHNVTITEFNTYV